MESSVSPDLLMPIYNKSVYIGPEYFPTTLETLLHPSQNNISYIKLIKSVNFSVEGFYFKYSLICPLYHNLCHDKYGGLIFFNIFVSVHKLKNNNHLLLNSSNLLTYLIILFSNSVSQLLSPVISELRISGQMHLEWDRTVLQLNL